MNKVQVAKFAALLIALSACQPPALANDLESLFVDLFAKGQPNAAAPQQNTVKNNVEARRKQIDADLTAGVRSGAISAPQEADIRTRLNYIGTLQNGYLGDGLLSNLEAGSLFGEVVRTDKQLRYYLSTPTAVAPALTTLVSSSSTFFGSGALRNVDRLCRQIDADLRKGVSDGKVTQPQEADIRTRLNYITTLQTNYLSDGVLSDADLTSLTGEADRTDKQLRYYLSIAAPATLPVTSTLTTPTSAATIDARIAQLESRVQAASRAGALGWSDSQQARADIDKIRQKQRDCLHDGSLAPAEEQVLVEMLNAFDVQLAASSAARNRGFQWNRNDFGRGNSSWAHGDGSFKRGSRYGYSRDQQSIDQSQSRLKERIWSGLQSRRLTQKEADRLLKSYYRIESLEQQLFGDGRISTSDRKRLRSELDALAVRINQELSDRHCN